MSFRKFFSLVFCLLFAVLGILGCHGKGLETPVEKRPTQVAALAQHQQRFSPRIEKVGDRVYSAIGYALANSIMVAVDGGKVIVDTTESVEAAREIKVLFDKLVPGPVLAVIYTHTHADHVLGTSVFAAPGVPIWAGRRAIRGLDQQFASLGATIRTRAARQFGEPLSDDVRISNGIGPFLRLDKGATPPLLYPTETFEGKTELVIGGVTFVLQEAPGETHDQLFVWLPKQKTLLSGDNLYVSFPNLYSTRGVSPRPVKQWMESLAAMRALKPEHLVPSHTEPVSGAEKIDELLTVYRDAIAFVHDSVIRMANEGKSVDDMVELIQLPPHLRDHPYLQEYYGMVAWSVRGIYDGYLGWFDGNPTSLFRTHPRDRAAKMISMMGGREAVLAQVQSALATKQWQWAAELADLLLAVDPKDGQAVSVKADAIENLGLLQANANARCYMLSYAMELREQSKGPGNPKINAETLRDIPMRAIMTTFPERVDPVKTRDVQMTIGFEFTDTGEHYTMRIRRGVGEVTAQPATEADLRFVATTEFFKALITGTSSSALLLASKKVEIDGGLGALLKFQSYLIDL